MLRNMSAVRLKIVQRRAFSSSVLGIVRENYGIWERRVPLCPHHVETLVRSGVKVVVQPSSVRIFSDAEYAAVGAELNEDLKDADVVLGVKQVPKENLLPDRAYFFFSHTIKAQPENMALLQACLEKKIKLFDYECILEDGVGKRLVAFGSYAGIVGMVDVLQGLGQRLLADGFSTPFLNLPMCYMHPSLEVVKQAVYAMGGNISKHGLPTGTPPLVFTFTGSGNVAKGALEIFKLLPHEMVDPAELPALLKRVEGTEEARRKVYGVIATPKYLVRRVSDGGFDYQEYKQHPGGYEPIFHETLAPHTTVLVNGIYWDQRFPRVLTKEELRRLYHNGKLRLRAVADISCDINGSIEFLTRATNTENPFYEWNAEESVESSTLGAGGAAGVLMSAVDILPSSLPADASKHFGDALMPLITPMLTGAGIGPELSAACITANGSLCGSYKYIEELDKERQKHADSIFSSIRGLETPEAADAHATDAFHSGAQQVLLVQGHLFDSGFINQTLDLIEVKGGTFKIRMVDVAPNLTEAKLKTKLVLWVAADSEEELQSIIGKINALADVLETADASIETLNYASSYSASSSSSPSAASTSPSASASSSSPGFPMKNVTSVVNNDQKKVLLLGAGLVTGPAVEYLTRNGAHHVTIASKFQSEADSLAANFTERGCVTPITLDIGDSVNALGEEVNKADVVISLLPAFMHPLVAKECINKRTPLVTSSYVSKDMQALHDSARDAGVVLVNEAGLDPGMDHMSAMKVINDCKANGEKLIRFSSVCGGLPSPEAIGNDNPFLYKFSWSPAGVLTAAKNSAQYLRDGKIVQVPGDSLLSSAEAFKGWPSLNLEVLPNRDSTIYGDLYGISDTAKDVFRGTLRYAGWSELMYGCKELGLFDTTDSWSWAQVLERPMAPKTKAALEWL
mmetsp:Transcript_68140/g.106517  ORF Transcript_68140/g.106517 Transcript_68140/m.106517 type:complete len:914 (-) Transcript_68140:26-2767(-)